MAEQQLIGALEAGGTKMVCATGYADGTVLEREQIATTTPQETVEAVNAWFADKGIAALGIGAFGPTAVNPASPQYGKILETPKTAWRYFDLLGAHAQSHGCAPRACRHPSPPRQPARAGR